MGARPLPAWTGVAWGAAGAAIASLAGYWWDVVRWLEDFEQLAGWGQAFGGVASILFSGWFVAQQIRASRELEYERHSAEQRAQRLTAMRSVLFHSEALESLIRIFGEGFAKWSEDKDEAYKLRVAAMEVQLQARRDAFNSANVGLFSDSGLDAHYKCLVSCSLALSWCEQFRISESKDYEDLSRRLVERSKVVQEASEILRSETRNP